MPNIQHESLFGTDAEEPFDSNVVQLNISARNVFAITALLNAKSLDNFIKDFTGGKTPLPQLNRTKSQAGFTLPTLPTSKLMEPVHTSLGGRRAHSRRVLFFFGCFRSEFRK